MSHISSDRIGSWAVLFGGLLGAMAGIALLRLTQHDETERLAGRSSPVSSFYHDAAVPQGNAQGLVVNQVVGHPSGGDAAAKIVLVQSNSRSADASQPAQALGDRTRTPSQAAPNQAARSSSAVARATGPFQTSPGFGSMAQFLPPGTPNSRALRVPEIRPAVDLSSKPVARPVVASERSRAPIPQSSSDKSSSADEARRSLRHGMLLAGAGRWHDALADYDRALVLNPGLDDAHLLRGQALAALGRLDRAMEDYGRAAELRPEDPRPQLALGDACYDRGQWDQAVEHYTRAIHETPSPLAYHNRGSSYLALSRFDEAIQDFDRALREKSGVEARAYANRGYALQRQGRLEEALKDYDEAIRRESNNSLALSNRACVHHALHQFDRAIQDYTRALQLQPNDARTYTDRGSTYLASGDLERAIHDYDDAIRREPDSSEAIRGREIILRRWRNAKLAHLDVDRRLLHRSLSE